MIAMNIVGLGTGTWGFYCDEHKHEDLAKFLITAGIIINGISFGWFLLIHFNMGKAWSSQPEALKDHILVQSGMFKFCRHPMYTGFLYHTVPISLLTLNWFVTLSWLIFVVYYFLIVRIPVEERILMDVFGSQYHDYRRKVPPLGPGTMWLSASLQFDKLE